MKKRTRCGKGISAVLLIAVCASFTGCAKPIEEGAELLEEGKYAEAIESFETAIEKERNIGEAYRGIGICYWEQEDYEKAAEAFENALDNGADKTATIYNFLGICEMKFGSYKKAAFYFQNGQAKEDAGAELLQAMAYNEIAAYEADGDYTAARTKLTQYVAQYPEDTRAVKELEFLSTQAPEETGQ